MRFIAYIALMAATFAAAGETRAELAAFALIVEAALLAFCAVQAGWLRRGVSLHLELAARVPAGGTVQGALVVENRAPFPVLRGDAGLDVRNLWGSVICSGRASFVAGAGVRAPGRACVPFTLGAVYCAGPLTVRAGSATVGDMLGLFRVRVNASVGVELFVMPAGDNVEIAEPLGAAMREDAALTSAPTGAVTPPELDEVRAYRPGDNLRAVHWKLSARRDELLTRVFAREGQSTAVLEVDCGTLADHDALRLSSVLEATAAVLAALDAAGVPCPAWVRVRGGADTANRTCFVEGGADALPVPDRLEQMERFLGGEARSMRKTTSGARRSCRLFSRSADGAKDSVAAAKSRNEGAHAGDTAAFASSDAGVGSEHTAYASAADGRDVPALQEMVETGMGGAANTLRLAISATAVLSVNGRPVAQFSPHGREEGVAAAKERAPWR